MELLPVLRRLWRRRILLAAGILVAVATLVALGGTSPVTTRGAAGVDECRRRHAQISARRRGAGGCGHLGMACGTARPPDGDRDLENGARSAARSGAESGCGG